MRIELSGFQEEPTFNIHAWEDITMSFPGVISGTPAEIEGTMTKIENYYCLDAIVKATLSISCDRCLHPVDVHISFPMNEKYACIGDLEEETIAFEGSFIDITPQIMSNVAMHIPMKVLCDDGCKGICPVCGQNKNQQDCQCEGVDTSNPFESLRSLFKVDEEV